MARFSTCLIGKSHGWNTDLGYWRTVSLARSDVRVSSELGPWLTSLDGRDERKKDKDHDGLRTVVRVKSFRDFSCFLWQCLVIAGADRARPFV